MNVTFEFTRYAVAFARETERIWPTPDGQDRMQRQVCATTEELGEVSRALLKRSHAARSPFGAYKGQTVDQWTLALHQEIAQLIGCALTLAAVEQMDVDVAVATALNHLRARDCILFADAHGHET